jgi:hypothetical protein
MYKFAKLSIPAAVLALAAGSSTAQAQPHSRTLVVTMTNDATSNEIKVFDADTQVLLQTLATHGQGGVGGNARGVRQLDGDLVAAVNNGSNTVALFSRAGDSLKFDKVVSTTSAPVSIDFGNGHMYVAGATTVDSFVLREKNVEGLDGTTGLALAGGGAPPSGSTAQLGVLNETEVLVTLKTDPDPGTVDIVPLVDGRVSGAAPTAVSAPDGTLAPFGFAVADGTAIITLAHSDQDGLFRDGAFVSVTDAGQAAPCWMTRAGKYVFTANTGSKTISRLIATGNSVFVDSLVGASIATGGAPSDIDSEAGVLAVIDHGGGQSHVSLFTYNTFGELTVYGTTISVGAANANGIALMSRVEQVR